MAPEVRYWTDSVNVRHFFGANLIYSHYNVGGITFPFGLYKSVRHERRQGDLGAVGLFYGYSWPLGRYWNIEAAIGAAVGYTKYSNYACGHCGRKIGNGRKVFAMPQAALNVVYNIPGRPRRAEAEPVAETVVVSQPAREQPATAVVAMAFTPALTAVPDFTGRAGQLEHDNPALAHVSQYRPYDRSQILRRNKDALYVHFPLGKADLATGYRENERIMQRITDVTRQIMADTTSSVKKIQIIGLASIEGRIAVNERLAQNRAKALQDYIQAKVGVPDSLFDTVGGGEAWADFRDQLSECAAEQSPRQAELRQALDIIDSETDTNRREQRLRQLNGGRTWAYLKQHILSDQRNSGYIRIYYDYVPDERAAIINRASQLLRTDCGACHRQALEHLLPISDDERAQNALGVAYWLCGQKQEALQCLRRAAASGNADARENLRQLEREQQ